MTFRYFTMVVCAVLSLAVAGSSSTAFAQKKAAPQQADQTQLSSVLGDISWGDRKNDVVQKMRSAMLTKLREDPKLRSDRTLMQEEHRKVLARVKAIEDSYTELKGERSGYEVSVISGEFMQNNGESMLRVRDDVAQRFYFFIDGQFYRMVVAYNPDYLAKVGFEAFVVQTARRYGKPVSTEYGEVRGEEELIQVTWNDGGSELRVENKKEFFATFSMTFTDAAMLKRLQSSQRNVGTGGAVKRDAEVSALVQGLSDSAANDRNERVVDHLVGNISVDLSDGRPREDIQAEIEEEAAAIQAAADEKAGKSKKATKKKKTTKKKPARDFGNIDTKSGGDDLIIY